MKNSGVVRSRAGIARRLGLARPGINLHVGHFVAHKARSAKIVEHRHRTVDLVGVQHITGEKRSPRAARVDVIDLSAGHQVIEGVALQCFCRLQADKVRCLLENRVLRRHLRDVGDGDLVTPLLALRRNLLNGHLLTNRRDALRQRLIRQRYTLIPRCSISRPVTLRKRRHVAELVHNQLAASEREGFIGDIL